MAKYTAPREIICGRECVEQLSCLRGKRAMVITAGEKMEQRGFLSRALHALRRTGMQTDHYKAEVEKEPEARAQAGAAAMRAFLPDWIIALGSESVTTAKLIWIFYEYPEATLLDLRIPESIPLLRRKARFAAIPGLDQTVEAAAAAASLDGTAEQAAWTVYDTGLVPDMVFLDPEMLAAEPAESAAETAAAVFARAADAFSARDHQPFTSPQAAEAARLALSYAKGAMNGEGEALFALQYAETLAGIAFSNVLHAPSAAFARQIAGRFPCAEKRQGTLALSFLPYVIRCFAANEEAAQRYTAFAATLGIKGKTQLQAALNLAKASERFFLELGLPQTLQEMGFDADCFERDLDVIASRTAEDLYTDGGFRTLTQGEAKAVLQDILQVQKD